MATALTVTLITRSGVDEDTPMAAADAAGNNWPTTGTEWLRIKNADASLTCNVTLAISQTVDGQPVTGRVVAIAHGHTKCIGPFPSPAYPDANNPAKMNVTYDQVANVTVGVFRAN
jgi:hypothetical protein